MSYAREAFRCRVPSCLKNGPGGANRLTCQEFARQISRLAPRRLPDEPPELVDPAEHLDGGVGRQPELQLPFPRRPRPRRFSRR